MISRRNIRVKVMQTIYKTLLDDEKEKNAKGYNPLTILTKHFDNTRSLMVYLIWFLTEIPRYSEKLAHQRASKHLPTQEDLTLNTKIAGNEMMWKILNDAALKEQIAKDKPQLRTDEELIRKIYLELIQKDEYKKYIAIQSRTKEDETAIMEFILNDMMLANEEFTSHAEEIYSNWDDDGEMLIQLLVNYMHKPGHFNFKDMLGADKRSFAENLTKTVIEKSEHLQDLIIPKLKNWDPERIALIDMILMKMGVAEFLYFETIPPKVTINEYIDLAKEYSTVQSGHFVNGILDNIHKELVQQGKMQKVEYKKGGG
jgi:transcription antitermination protein NusB